MNFALVGGKKEDIERAFQTVLGQMLSLRGLPRNSSELESTCTRELREGPVGVGYDGPASSNYVRHAGWRPSDGLEVAAGYCW